jgi:hypothetical protein
VSTYSRVLLSGSTSGMPIVVGNTATPGNIVHTAIAGATSFDELYIWASNVAAATATLSVEWGGVTDPASHIIKLFSLPANSPPIPIATGQVLNGGLLCRAFSGTANAVNLTGYVNRISA